MKFKPFLVLLLILFFSFILPVEIEAIGFKQLRLIGDDDTENYMFFVIDSAIIGPNKSLYVVDRKGLFISQYSWDGKFIRKKGQKGVGPGDYVRPTSLQYYQDHLYVMDFYNGRFAKISLDLGNQTYYRLENFKDLDNKKSETPQDFKVLTQDALLGIYGFYKSSRPRLCLFNTDQQILKLFHNYLPGNGKIRMNQPLTDYYMSKPIIGVNHRTKMILVSSFFANNAIDFFLYNFSGNLVKQFSWKQAEKYQFPVRFANAPKKEKKPKSGECWSAINLIKGFRNGFCVFLEQIEVKSENEKTEPLISCLIFSKEGKLLHKIDTPHRFLALDVTDDGYVLGKKLGQDYDQLVIYKLEL